MKYKNQQKKYKPQEQLDIFIFSEQSVVFPFPQNHYAYKIQIVEV